jgi:hypothetical protein
MTDEEFNRARERLQSIADGDFPHGDEIDKQLAKVNRDIKVVNKMAARLERKLNGHSGESAGESAAGPIVVVKTTSVNGTNVNHPPETSGV